MCRLQTDQILIEESGISKTNFDTRAIVRISFDSTNAPVVFQRINKVFRKIIYSLFKNFESLFLTL